MAETSITQGRNEAGQYVKGHGGFKPGNQYGKKSAPKKLFASALKKALEKGDDLQQIITKWIELAKEGNVQAIKELVETIDGKQRTIEHSGGIGVLHIAWPERRDHIPTNRTTGRPVEPVRDTIEISS